MLGCVKTVRKEYMKSSKKAARRVFGYERIVKTFEEMEKTPRGAWKNKKSKKKK